LYEDHSLPDLIWNETTRDDLQKCIEKELRTIQAEIIARGGMKYIAWNHHQFQVDYVCLRDEIKVGKIYLRLWLDTGESFIKSWNEPVQLFELLLRRLICDIDRDITVTNLCIRSLERLYSAHAVKI
jgi:DnaJ family protein C protein 13